MTFISVKYKGEAVQITRHSFARCSTVRRVITFVSKVSCDWCESSRKNENTLFEYGVEHDSGEIIWDEKYFCCADCRESYYR